MKDFNISRALLRRERTLYEFLEWLEYDGDRLVEAAELLGGADWSAHADGVRNAVIEGADPADLVESLRDLHRLLNLELADELGSLEAERFMSVHPDDPRADDARICAEAVERGLRALEERPVATILQGEAA